MHFQLQLPNVMSHSYLDPEPLVRAGVWPEGEDLDDGREDEGQRRGTHGPHQRDEQPDVGDGRGQHDWAGGGGGALKWMGDSREIKEGVI